MVTILVLLQWVDTARLGKWLKRQYHDLDDDDEELVDIDDELLNTVRVVVKMLLYERRGRRFYTPMIAHDQFDSISHVTQVFFVALSSFPKKSSKHKMSCLCNTFPLLFKGVCVYHS